MKELEDKLNKLIKKENMTIPPELINIFVSTVFDLVFDSTNNLNAKDAKKIISKNIGNNIDVEKLIKKTANELGKRL